jgi:hypothetical protein
MVKHIKNAQKQAQGYFATAAHMVNSWSLFSPSMASFIRALLFKTAASLGDVASSKAGGLFSSAMAAGLTQGVRRRAKMRKCESSGIFVLHLPCNAVAQTHVAALAGAIRHPHRKPGFIGTV